MSLFRFLTDQDVYFSTTRFLRERGFDVKTASELGMQRASDENILRKAKKLRRILITRDKDFGALTFLRDDLKTGVILLRMSPSNLKQVHEELLNVLNKHSFEELKQYFCVIEPGRHRLRKLF